MTSGEESFKLEKEPGWWLWHGHLPTSDLQYSESDNNFVDGEPDWKWVASSPVYDGLVDKEPLSLSSKPDSDVFGVPKRSRKQRGWYQVRARRPRGSPILMARQLSRSRLAAELPAELVHMVVEALSSRSGSRKYLSICSTVCRHWAEALRPILFAEITLRSRTHILELLAFLAVPLSKIAEYIEQITLAHTLPNVPLLHLLPRLSERLEVRYGATIVGPLPRTCSTSMRTIHWQLPRPIRHPNVLAFTEVTIEDVHIPAFADLVRLVWELPLLEAFRGTRLTWGAEDNLLRPHRIPAGRDFGELPGPDIALRNCASSQLWLAASLTGGLLALPDEYERIGALLRIVSSQLSDAQQIEVTARSFTWSGRNWSSTVSLEIPLSQSHQMDGYSHAIVTAITLRLSWGSTVWISSVDWTAFATAVASFPHLQHITVEGNMNERNEFIQQMYDTLAVVCPWSKLRLENFAW